MALESRFIVKAGCAVQQIPYNSTRHYVGLEGIPHTPCNRYVPHQPSGNPQKLVQALQSIPEKCITGENFFRIAAELDVDPNHAAVQQVIREVQYGIRFLK